jgi:TRAP transporter TAXI family solute receptor
MSGLLRRRETLFLAVALILGLFGLIFVYLSAPTRLSVAVGPPGTADDTLMQTFARLLGQQKTGIRLRVQSTPDVREAAQALERGGADLAVVRSDVALPQNGLTMAVLRDAAVIIVAPTRAKLTKLPDFDGKKLGVVLSHEADPALIATLLKHFDLETPDVTIVPIQAAQAVPSLKAGQIDAVALIAPPTGSNASDFVRGVLKAYDGRITFVGIDEADAIAERNPALSVVTVPAGSWGGRPKQPPDEFKTVGVSYRLMARSEIDRSTISVATQYLFQMRSRLAAVTRAANFMKAPDNDTQTSAMLPNHPGAVDYFQREQETFMERYGDLVYLLAFFGSGIASALAWFRQRFIRRRREEIDDVLDRLLTILAEARDADTLARLDSLSAEIDTLLATAVEHARNGNTDSRATAALVLAIDGARAAIADRRREVAGGLALPPPHRDGAGPRLITVS